MSPPRFVYGTAWKEERTEALARLALSAGFRAIDTANQRKHYVEAGVGAAIRGVPRGELFLQTKFTYADGQDHRLPYDAKAATAKQVEQSFARSLEHLGVAHVDSYVLHGPSERTGWHAVDREAWQAMEALHGQGVARALGVSNVSLAQLESLIASAKVAPAYVQNRCYARTGWDSAVRALCRQHGIVYQGFSLLTANRSELTDRRIVAIAQQHAVSVAEVVFAFAAGVGMLPLTGTSDIAHMRSDLTSIDLRLSPAELATIEHIARHA